MNEKKNSKRAFEIDALTYKYYLMLKKEGFKDFETDFSVNKAFRRQNLQDPTVRGPLRLSEADSTNKYKGGSDYILILQTYLYNFPSLTFIEKTIIGLICDGYNQAEIVRKTKISLYNVRKIYKKTEDTIKKDLMTYPQPEWLQEEEEDEDDER